MLKRKVIVTLLFSLLLFVSTLSFSSFVFAEEANNAEDTLTLINDGESDAAIIWWSKDGTSVPQFAASELQTYLNKISGAEVPVIEGTLDHNSNPLLKKLTSGIVIVTGDQAKEYINKDKKVIPGEWLVSSAEKLKNAKEDAFAIDTKESKLILTGDNDRGTLYAGYHLLKELGVKFLAPNFDYYNGNAEVIPSKKTVIVSALNTLEEPDMKFRRKYMEEGWSFNQSNLKELVDWMAKHHLNILNAPYDYYGDGSMKWDDFRDQVGPELEKRGIIAEVGGHGFESFLPKSKYQKKHPDWFVDGYNVFNIANDEAVQEYVDQVVSYLKERPEVKIFDAWPPDGATWPPSVRNKFGSTTNAYAHLVNKLTDAVNEELPGVRIEAIAYSNHIDPPDAEHMFYDSTIIDFAPISRSQTVPIYDERNKNFVNLIKKWGEVYEGDFAMYTYYRRYSFHSAPVVLGKLIGEDIPYYKELGANGMGLYSEPADWIPFELTHLMLADMSWDTSTDPEAYIHDYVQNRYGKASDEMADYFDLVEDAGRIIYDQPFTNFDKLDDVTRAREDYLQAKDALTEAKKKVTDSSQAAFLLQRLDWNMDYTIADIDYSYYKLQNDESNMEKSKDKAMDLVRTHRFDGIILQNMYLMRRYENGVSRQNTLWLYDMYRGKSAVDLSLSSPESISTGNSFEVESTIRNYSKEAMNDVQLKLDVPKGWTVKPISETQFDTIQGDPTEAYHVKWEVTVPENREVGSFELTTKADYNYKEEKVSSTAKQSVSIVTHHPVTTMGIYQNYNLENMVDDNPSTFYWSNEGPGKNDSIGVDLGSEMDLHNIEILMASDTNTEDYIHDGVIEISSDGESWKEIKEIHEQPEISFDVPIDTKARYIRLRSTKSQSKWIQVREFSVKSMNKVSSLKKLVEHFEEKGEFASENTARSLKTHLTAVERFEKQVEADKVVKHMKGFIQLLKHQKENELISEKAFNVLMVDANDLLNQWK